MSVWPWLMWMDNQLVNIYVHCVSCVEVMPCVLPCVPAGRPQSEQPQLQDQSSYWSRGLRQPSAHGESVKDTHSRFIHIPFIKFYLIFYSCHYSSHDLRHDALWVAAQHSFPLSFDCQNTLLRLLHKKSAHSDRNTCKIQCSTIQLLCNNYPLYSSIK